MTRDDIRATLEKQLQLLSERSAEGEKSGTTLAAMSEAMEHISEFLFRTSRDSYPHDVTGVIRVEVDRQKILADVLEEMRDKHEEGQT